MGSLLSTSEPDLECKSEARFAMESSCFCVICGSPFDLEGEVYNLDVAAARYKVYTGYCYIHLRFLTPPVDAQSPPHWQQARCSPSQFGRPVGRRFPVCALLLSSSRSNPQTALPASTHRMPAMSSYLREQLGARRTISFSASTGYTRTLIFHTPSRSMLCSNLVSMIRSFPYMRIVCKSVAAPLTTLSLLRQPLNMCQVYLF